MRCVYLTPEDVLGIAAAARPEAPVLVRDVGLLAAGVHRPAATAFGQEAYADLPAKAAALLHSLITDRALLAGNRRTAWLACVTFLAVNGLRLRPDTDAAERLVAAVVAREADDVDVIAQALRELVLPGRVG